MTCIEDYMRIETPQYGKRRVVFDVDRMIADGHFASQLRAADELGRALTLVREANQSIPYELTDKGRELLGGWE